MLEFQYYRKDIESARVSGITTIDGFVDSHRSSDSRALFEKINDAERDGDMEKKAKLKVGLMHYTPCVRVRNKRRYADIVGFTGVAVLDFDHLPDEDYSEAFKHYLMNKYAHIFLCYCSPSKRGVKAFVRIPVCRTVDEFKSYYYGLSYYMEYYNGYDIAPQNAVLPLFQSYDETLLYKDFDTCPVWKKTAYKVNDFTTATAKVIEFKREISHGDKESCIKAICTMINAIIDNGYPQVRSAGLVAGGYVGGGYLSFYEAESLLHGLIDSNSYLQKSIKVYKSCASWAISEGTKKPLYRDGF